MGIFVGEIFITGEGFREPLTTSGRTITSLRNEMAAVRDLRFKIAGPSSHNQNTSRLLFRAPVEPYLALNRSSLAGEQPKRQRTVESLEGLPAELTEQSSVEYFYEQSHPISATLFTGDKTEDMEDLRLIPHLLREKSSLLTKKSTVQSQECPTPNENNPCRNCHEDHRAENACLRSSPTTVRLERMFTPPRATTTYAPKERVDAGLSHETPYPVLSNLADWRMVPVPFAKDDINNNPAACTRLSELGSIIILTRNDFSPGRYMRKRSGLNRGLKRAFYDTVEETLVSDIPTIRRMRRSRRVVVCHINQRKSHQSSTITKLLE